MDFKPEPQIKSFFPIGTYEYQEEVEYRDEDEDSSLNILRCRRQRSKGGQYPPEEDEYQEEVEYRDEGSSPQYPPLSETEVEGGTIPPEEDEYQEEVEYRDEGSSLNILRCRRQRSKGGRYPPEEDESVVEQGVTILQVVSILIMITIGVGTYWFIILVLVGRLLADCGGMMECFNYALLHLVFMGIGIVVLNLLFSIVYGCVSACAKMKNN